MFDIFRRILNTKGKSASHLYLTNTLTKQKEVFSPRNPKKVNVYSCGPTVYGKAHVGNLRAYVFADILHRTLQTKGYTLNHVINITDVGHLESDQDEGEDKIEKAAKETSLSAKEITKKYTNLFFEDLSELNINIQEYTFPKATEYIQEQIDFITSLEKQGNTYQIDDGIYFDTSTFKEYGKLGNMNIEHIKEGARIEMNPQKRNPSDFALWKFSKTKRQQEWDSPWGIGFPGWHIECSAMALATLGKHIDIHTGGEEHAHTHHNNEIAQSESLLKKPFVSFWLHNAFLNINNIKISKSLKNSIYLSDIIEKNIDPLALRYLFLEAHYRSPLSFSFESTQAAEKALSRLRTHTNETNGKISKQYKQKFLKALYNDLNTSQALAIAWDLTKDKKINKNDISATLLYFDTVLGLKLSKKTNITIPKEIHELVEKRKELRDKKDYSGADMVRKEIENKGFTLHDNPEGTTVDKK